MKRMLITWAIGAAMLLVGMVNGYVAVALGPIENNGMSLWHGILSGVLLVCGIVAIMIASVKYIGDRIEEKDTP